MTKEEKKLLKLKRTIQKRLLLFLYANRDSIEIIKINHIFIDCGLDLLQMRKMIVELGHRQIIEKMPNHADWGTSVAGQGQYNLNNAILYTRLTPTGVSFVEDMYWVWSRNMIALAVSNGIALVSVGLATCIGARGLEDRNELKGIQIKLSELQKSQLLLSKTTSPDDFCREYKCTNNIFDFHYKLDTFSSDTGNPANPDLHDRQ